MEFVGVSSKIPFFSGYHYLLLDIDGKRPCLIHDVVERFKRLHLGMDWWFEITKNGLHFVFFHPFRFEEVVYIVTNLFWDLVDRTWFEIGLHRGYWFLITYHPLLKLGCRFMVLKPKKNVLESEWFRSKWRVFKFGKK